MRISRDVNGNKILKVSGTDLGNKAIRGFSVQTLDNLPQTHKNDLSCLPTVKAELIAYVAEYGSDSQKNKLKFFK